MSNVNKSKRSLSHSVAITESGRAEIVWQVTNYGMIFIAGSHPLIHGKVSISPANHGTPTPGRGSLVVPHFQNGKNLGRVPFSGSMANVSDCSALRLSQILMASPFYSGRWQERYLVR
jgi:hypothetical protein